MLVNPLEYLREGRASGWAVGAFSVYNLESARAVIAAATNLKAPVMVQDEFLYRGERASWSGAWLAKNRWLAEHILYGRDHRPYLTHFIVTVEKRPGTSRRRLTQGR